MPVIPTSSGTAVQSFALSDWSGSGSPGFARMGMAFKKGDVPAGSVPALSRGAYQFDARNAWPDGSLKFAVAHVRDAAFTASESRTIGVSAATGVFNNAGMLTLASILSGHDFKVQFTSVNQYDGSTVSLRGSGTFTASLNSHAAVATRVTKVHSGPVCEGWVVWGMAADGGVADAHLKTYWHIDAWKNADGSIAALEVAAVVAQDWWSVADKYRLDYSAALMDGATTIATYSGIQHPYRSQWITCRTATDNNAGKRHWLGNGVNIPTLLYKPDRAYWIASGLLPPLDLSLTPPGGAPPPDYVPCGNLEHRAFIDGTGPYLGRGLMGGQADSDAWLLQTAQSVARARVNAHAGLHVPYHYRSSATRTRPGEAADTASTPISQILAPKAASAYTFTADGMPAPQFAYSDGRNDGTHKGGYVGPAGGSGVWTTTDEASHAVSYSSGMYRLEGETYHLEATLDLASNLVHQGIWGYNMGGMPVMFRAPEYSYLGAPSVSYDAIAGLWNEYNPRAQGWAAAVLGEAGLCPDDHVAANYFKTLIAHNGEWLGLSLDYTPADVKAVGAMWPAQHWGGVGSPWAANAFVALGMCHAYRMTGNAAFRDFGHAAGNWTVGVFDSSPWMTAVYRCTYRARQDDGWDHIANPCILPSQSMWGSGGPWVEINNSTFIQGGPYWDAIVSPVRWANGDKVVFSTSGGGVIPPEVVKGQIYYVVQVSSTTVKNASFKIAATPGGAPITFATNYGGSINLSWLPLFTSAYTVAQNPPGPYTPISDTYEPAHGAAFALLRATGHPGATTALNTKVNTFLSAVQRQNYSPWALASA